MPKTLKKDFKPDALELELKSKHPVFHNLHGFVDGRRKPPVFITWYFILSILISMSVWFMPDSVVNYQIAHDFINFVEREFAPKITGLKALALQGYIAPKIVFYNAIVSFWLVITFLPLILVEASFMSKKVLLSDYAYYREKVFSVPPAGNPKKKYTINKEIVLAVILFTPLFIWGGLYAVVDDPSSRHFHFMSKSPLIAFYCFSIISGNLFIAALIVNIKSRIILMRHQKLNKTKEVENE